MPNRIINIAAVAILTTALAFLIVACSDSEAGMSRADVEDVVRSELASQPAAPEPGASVAEVERIVQDSIADIPEPPLGITSAEVEEILSGTSPSLLSVSRATRWSASYGTPLRTSPSHPPDSAAKMSSASSRQQLLTYRPPLP